MDDVKLIANFGGFAIGIIFGFFAQSSRFCFLSALRDAMFSKRSAITSSVLIAMSLSLIATQLLRYIYDLDIGSSIYLDTTPSFLVLIGGAIMFSFGIVLSNACPNRHLILLVSGNLRSLLVILIMSISAYMTVRGLLAQPRIWLETQTIMEVTYTSLDGLLAETVGISASLSSLLVTLALSILLLFGAWKWRPKVAHYYSYCAAIIIGLTVSLGWYVTGYLGYDEFEPIPLQSLTFTVPPGETLVYLMTYTGSSLTFGIAIIFGVLAGGLISALLTRTFTWQSLNNVRQTLRLIVGAVLMGVGAVMSVGCTIGQGLSGFSTLSLSSLVVVITIVITSWVLLKRSV